MTSTVTKTIFSVALGAAIIEKHLTLARADGGPDSGFSLEPAEFKALCAACATTYRALGDGSFTRPQSEAAASAVRRSLYVVADITEGEPLTARNIRSIRPGLGLAPSRYQAVLGRPARRNLARTSAVLQTLLQLVLIKR